MATVLGWFSYQNLCSFPDNSGIFNPFIPNVFPIFINWTSPFPILGLLGGIIYFYSNFKRNFCKQTVENLIRRRVLWTLGLYLVKDYN